MWTGILVRPAFRLFLQRCPVTLRQAVFRIGGESRFIIKYTCGSNAYSGLGKLCTENKMTFCLEPVTCTVESVSDLNTVAASTTDIGNSDDLLPVSAVITAIQKKKNIVVF